MLVRVFFEINRRTNHRLLERKTFFRLDSTSFCRGVKAAIAKTALGQEMTIAIDGYELINLVLLARVDGPQLA